MASGRPAGAGPVVPKKGTLFIRGPSLTAMWLVSVLAGVLGKLLQCANAILQ